MRLQALTSHLDNQRIEVGGAKGIGGKIALGDIDIREIPQEAYSDKVA